MTRGLPRFSLPHHPDYIMTDEGGVFKFSRIGAACPNSRSKSAATAKSGFSNSGDAQSCHENGIRRLRLTRRFSPAQATNKRAAPRNRSADRCAGGSGPANPNAIIRCPQRTAERFLPADARIIIIRREMLHRVHSRSGAQPGVSLRVHSVVVFVLSEGPRCAAPGAYPVDRIHRGGHSRRRRGLRVSFCSSSPPAFSPRPARSPRRTSNSARRTCRWTSPGSPSKFFNAPPKRHPKKASGRV